MKLWQILKNVNAPENETEVKQTPASEPVAEETKAAVQETKTAVQETKVAVEKVESTVNTSMSVFSDKLAKFEEMMRSMPLEEAPSWYDDITINDVERGKIEEYMKNIKMKYFSDLEMYEGLAGEFIWCMPRPLYETFADMEIRMEPDVLNPMFWFLLPCLKIDTEEKVLRFLKTAFGLLTGDIVDKIDKLLGIEDETSDEEEDVDYIPSDIYDYPEEPEEEVDIPPMLEETFEAEEANPDEIDMDAIAEASSPEETKEENKNE